MFVLSKHKQKGKIKMIKKLGELKVNKSADYYDEVMKTLKDAGFVLVLDWETTSERYYIVAKNEE